MKTRLGFVAAGVAALLLLAAPAFAHITVDPSSIAKGTEFGSFGFRVPNEQDDASTTQVEIDFPTDQPFAIVETKPLEGWTATVRKAQLKTPIKTDDGDVTETIDQVIWTGGKIAPGQYQEFEVLAGPFPDSGSQMVFKAIQTYDNGDVVRWIDPIVEGQDEPEHPTPILTLTAATGDDHHGSSSDDAMSDSKDASSSDGTARAIGGIGIALGVVGIATAAMSRRSAKAPTS